MGSRVVRVLSSDHKPNTIAGVSSDPMPTIMFPEPYQGLGRWGAGGTIMFKITAMSFNPPMSLIDRYILNFSNATIINRKTDNTMAKRKRTNNDLQNTTQ